ncbi:DNA repair protein RecO [Xanthovirga aplysinae]|uniref:DNA repair protein RecO n=1 Tax=Xanthovirga aplysinae TaxID=2529853 RepID=UPI0012BD6D91|nr:DNA repair protein RecO [Xanthovirga aplysinae]MTI33618.1 DNA repair protein RecO [Xanthovirga aplysinae]
MLHKSRGIALNYIKYKESSIIARIYTELFGLQSYVINGVRSKKSRYKVALFQPLTLLDLVVYKREHAGLNRISEVKCSNPFASIPFDVKKSGIALFLTEVLVKSVREEEPNPSLFAFLEQSILMLDHLESHYENFHLQFLLKLSKYLGFGAATAHDFFEQLFPFTDLKDMALTEEQSINQLTILNYQNDFHLSNKYRREILGHILQFFKLHLENFGEVKSLAVLKEIMS